MKGESKRMSKWWGCLNIILNSEIFILKIYISGAWIKEDLKCDPTEKIWVKNEFKKWSYEFLKFIDFSRFYFWFQVFFGILKAKKSQKMVYMSSNRVELKWHNANTWRHHGGWHRSMQAHMGAYVELQICQAKCVGPTSIVGPIGRIRGSVLGPVGDKKA